jgi:molecular chaperone DnaK (HSP70)
MIGLDFGSSNSCIAIWRDDKNKVKVIKNERGKSR